MRASASVDATRSESASSCSACFIAFSSSSSSSAPSRHQTSLKSHDATRGARIWEPARPAAISKQQPAGNKPQQSGDKGSLRSSAMLEVGKASPARGSTLVVTSHHPQEAGR